MTSANNAVPPSPAADLATLSWGHELSPRTTACDVQYGHVFGQPGNPGTCPGDSDTYALSATLMHQLNDKLTEHTGPWTNNTSSVGTRATRRASSAPACAEPSEAVP